MGIRVLDDRLTYASWNNMCNRCRGTKLLSADDYIGRGITVCERWLGPDGFETFRADMGPRPGRQFSLDRIDNDKGYTPENCRWATRDQQRKNQRGPGRNEFSSARDSLTYNGVTRTYAEWVELQKETGLNVRKLRQRIKAEWSIGEALGFEPHKIKRTQRPFPERKRRNFVNTAFYRDPEHLGKLSSSIRAFYEELRKDPERHAAHVAAREAKRRATIAARRTP